MEIKAVRTINADAATSKTYEPASKYKLQTPKMPSFTKTTQFQRIQFPKNELYSILNDKEGVFASKHQYFNIKVV